MLGKEGESVGDSIELNNHFGDTLIKCYFVEFGSWFG